MSITASDDVQNIVAAAEKFAAEHAQANLREKMRTADMQVIRSNSKENKHKPTDAQNEMGLLLSPFVIEEYERVLPGAAARLLMMAEREQRYRHDQERMKLETATRDAWVGLIFACTFILSIISLCISAALIFNGMQLAGGLMAVGSFGGITFIFISTVIRNSGTKPQELASVIEGESMSRI